MRQIVDPPVPAPYLVSIDREALRRSAARQSLPRPQRLQSYMEQMKRAIRKRRGWYEHTHHVKIEAERPPGLFQRT